MRQRLRTITLTLGVMLTSVGGIYLVLGMPQGPRVYGQVQVAGAAPPVASDPKKAPSVEAMTFPTDRDAKNMIQAVKDYLKEYEGKSEKAPWDRICQAAQQVLDAKSDSFFELPKASPDAPQGRVSAKAEINRLIGQFPKEGRQFYQLAHGAAAENLLAQARNNNFDRAILADVSQRYFHTKAGAQATLLLASIQLERGNYIEAAYSFERLLERPDSDEYWTPLNIFKAMTAMKRTASASNATAIRKLRERLEKSFPREGLTIGRRQFSLDELNAELERPFDTIFGKVSEAYVSMRYGNPSHTGLGDGGKPFLDPVWSVSHFYRMSEPELSEGNTWVRQNLDDVLRTINPAKLDVALPGFFPATAQNLVFFRSYDGVYAFITKDGFNNHGKPARAGDIYWWSPSKGSAASLVANASKVESEGLRKQDLENHWRYYRDQANPNLKTLLFENPLAGSLTHDGRAVYYVDDAALPPPPPNMNNEFGGFMPVVPAGTGTANKMSGLIDGSRLIALNIQTGNILWQLGETVSDKPLTSDEEEDRSTNTALLFQNSFFLGPPLPLNGKIYVLYERNGVIRLACLDPGSIEMHKVRTRTKDPNDPDKTIVAYPEQPFPKLLWIQRLGEPNVRLPQDTIRRFQCSYLAYSDGVMICPTNAGAVVAVDIMSRSLLWARSYRTVATGTNVNPRSTRLIVGGQPATAAGGQSVLRGDRWRAAAPIISQGRVLFAAFDSDSLYALNLRTGDVIWKEPMKSNDLYLGGLVGDKLLVVGKDQMRALKVIGKAKEKPTPDATEDPIAAWPAIKIGIPAGHGVATRDGTYYLPVAESSDEKYPQVWAIDVAKGEVMAKAAYRKKDLSDSKPMLGNLVFHEDQLYSQSATELAVFPLMDLKKKEMNRLLAANPKDPVGLAARGEMYFEEGKTLEAIADFAAAAQHNPPEGVAQRMRDKLFMAYTTLLRKDFNAGEKYLDDYKDLCNVRTDAEDPNQKLKQMEERTRRQRLYLELLARGRESQGRLTEAFDHYRAYASFGGNKELVSLSDEPNGKIRPDVWARGRIEGMIRNAKDEQTRKPLEALVDREWRAVQDGNDLAKLREFVSIFGQHFAVGREADLLLGMKLLESSRDEDIREAHTVLTRVAATAQEPILAARALESLARLSTKKGQQDSAVGYYSLLGEKYPDVKLRDNVTGADLYNDLLTDKRLLPHLEPVRLPTPARIKATQENTANNYVPLGYVLEPDGAEQEPFYRRHFIVLANNENGGNWVLRVHDRATGAEKWKVPNLQMYNPSGTLNYRIAQARGSILLLHLGVAVHAFDLAEKKRLWEYPVLGEGQRIDFNNARADVGPDEELIITYNTDGGKLSIGRSTIIENNYAALVTRDGLVVLDPATGSKLWSRTNISSSATIFGDARHIFIVENVGGKATSRVLRAVDGTALDGVPDFAPLVTGTGRVRILGRNLLLAEGSRTKPLTLRLYDPLAGKDVWKKEYAPMPEPEDYKQKGLEFNGSARLIKTFSPEIIGAFERDGKFELLHTITGRVLFQSRIDAKNAELHASMTGQPLLLTDADRYYLVLNKNADANNRVMNYWGGWNNLRTIAINGPMYCFEKATGNRAWYTERLLEGQQLIIERFGELPALISATYTQEEDEQGGGILARNRGGTNQVYRVAVIDKVNGRLRYLKNLSTNHGNFYAMTTDPRTATAKLIRQDLSLQIGPDDSITVDAGKKHTPQAAEVPVP